MSRIECRSPWAVRTKGMPAAIFHAVASGRARLSLEGSLSSTVELGTGEVALLAHGQAHRIEHVEHVPATPTDVASLAPIDAGAAIRSYACGGSGEPTRIICGSFTLQHAAAETMLRAMPPLLRAPASAPGGVGAWIETTVSQLADALGRDTPGSDAIVDKLTEVLVIQVLRACVEQAPRQGGGWLGALRDERIGRALAHMHGQPDGDWSVDRLATTAGMSRSSFCARFSELVGESPARYLARWRVAVAADIISRETVSLGELACRVGYGSEDAFSRVFKRFMGVTPLQFRRQLA